MLCRSPRKWLATMAFALPIIASAAGVSVRFDLSSPSSSPFPSDRFTALDFRQNTFRHVNLPKPDCAALPSDCADIDVINTLDGFNVQPPDLPGSGTDFVELVIPELQRRGLFRHEYEGRTLRENLGLPWVPSRYAARHGAVAD